MRRLASIAFAALAVACAVALPACSGQAESAGQEHRGTVEPVPANAGAYAPGELIVGLAEGADEGAVRDRIVNGGFHVETTLTHASDYSGALLLVATDDARLTGADLENAARSIACFDGVDCVQPNYRYSISADVKAQDLASDGDVPEQWYLNGWDDSHGANVAAAWAVLSSRAAGKVDVAVLDTGAYVMQEYDPSGEGPVTSEADFHQEFDASNLDVDHAVDFVHSPDNSAPAPLVNAANPYGDDNGHGTHVSGIVAALAHTAQASGNRPVGMAGVSPVARVIPVKVLDAGGEGSTADFLSAYDYLLGNSGPGGIFENLHVINMSLSLTFDDSGDLPDESVAEPPTSDYDGDFVIETDGDGDPGAETTGPEVAGNTALRQMIKAAEARGIVTVCAAGNDASSAITYPGDYDECVSVVALDPNGADAAYSNINEYKDISAPGTDIYSAWGSQADAYASLSGTSQATAIVSGVFSMLWAAHPGLTVDQAKSSVYRTAHPVVEDADVTHLRASATPGEGGGAHAGYSALGLQSVANGSHGAIDAAAALEYADREGWNQLDVSPIGAGSVSFPKSTYVYTGKKLSPAPVVTVGGKTLSPKADYSLSYSANTNPGTAKVTVVGKGAYSGSLVGTFKIALGTTKVKKAKAGTRSATVTWARQKNGKVGYQVRYSTKKSMKGAKTKTLSKNSTTKVKLAKLKAHKRYYVQVRTYKKIGKAKKYSAWSAKKAVKVR